MSKPAIFAKRIVSAALKAVARARSMEELRAAQAVLLPALHGLSMAQTGVLIGVSRASVGRLQQRGRKHTQRGKLAVTTHAGWGGRRRAHMTWQEEEEFLRPWREQAQSAGLLVLSPIRAALAQKLGQAIKASVVWRLLARHGWRKVAPDTRHPKSDPVAQEAWKKNSRKWCPGSSPRRVPPDSV